MPESAKRLPDEAERKLIETALDLNLLVEAAAGTGKTTGMVARMVELVATETCPLEHMAAVTFTRKAAAELRTRFREELEQHLESGSESGPRAAAIARALEQPGLGFVGTIHSFCARLLRERPVEAGIDPDFLEIEQEEDDQWREEVWREFIAKNIAAGDPDLETLAATGLSVTEQLSAYNRLCMYQDITAWPVPDGAGLPSAAELDRVLAPAIARIRPLVRDLPADTGNDELIPFYRRLLRMYAQADKNNPVEMGEILDTCVRRNVIQKVWGDTAEARKRAKEEGERWEEFCRSELEPLQVRLRSSRYAACIKFLRRAAEYYRDCRLEANRLNFTDLLISTRELLRGSREARTYFSRRYSHLLIDEFQDTDPVQAEIMLLLTAGDQAETDWTRCRPRAGALFVVGDPKQSIYRFRRADIITYNQVRAQIESSGGLVVSLSSNFRTQPGVIGWINRQFVDRFPGGEYSPDYVALQPARADTGGAVEQLRLDETGSVNKTAVLGIEPRIVAAAVRDLMSTAENGKLPSILVLTRKRGNLASYAAALDSLGIPNQVTGSSALGAQPQVRLLWLCSSSSANPDNAVALVALLRSEAFGFSDPELYAWVRAGNRFDYRVIGKLPEQDAELLKRYRKVFDRLKKYSRWLENLPPVAALERIAADMGLFAQAAGSSGGNQRAGGLARALELFRGRDQARDSLREALEILRRLVAGELDADSTEARPGAVPPVRVMNLHKAKGLEADVVFLADPTGGGRSMAVEVHVDRSSGSNSGYLAIYRQNPRGRSTKLVACHPDWPEFETRERLFLEAEDVRLLYVAATRARDKLVISRREKRNHENPWKDFSDSIVDCPNLNYGNLADQWRIAAKEKMADEGPGDPPDVDSLWRNSARAGYAVEQAKRLALQGAMAHPEAAGEHGTEWGCAVHLLLEYGAKNPGVDLGEVADKKLDKGEYGEISLPDAADTASRVLKSELWTRACSSDQMLAEVPFELMDRLEDGTPALVRGVVDLAFRERGGWVLADYKTDRGARDNLDELMAYYAPQLELYARAWEAATGEPVVEKGLYFTQPGWYKIVD